MSAYVDTAGLTRYRPIEGFEGYRVGSDGTVWSRWTHNGHQPRRLGDMWRQLKTQRDRGGYLTLLLCRDGRPYRRRVHRLVLEAFVGPRPNGMEACHNDGVPTNCSVGNLRWDTATANQLDRLTHGTHSRGTRNGNARLTEEAVREIRAARATGATAKSLAEIHGVTASHIRLVARCGRWSWL